MNTIFTRRNFLKASGFTAAGLMIGSFGCNSFVRAGSSDRKILKGFIVSDAHFGWTGDAQPTPQVQLKMMQHIMDQFPDLDIFIDTGDAHHNGTTDSDRGDWTDIIPGQCGTLPFYYVAGNHEIMHNKDCDAEWRCNKLGSVSCRPYYSFDLKGIHFISFPEMVRAVNITKESLEWLRMDMDLNKDKTMILLSHNNIRGTTYDKNEDGYRGLVNSPEMLALLEEYPNAIAWMHGHNHTYEVMELKNKLFVSNGRIGGFDPVNWGGDYGQGNLGGIYFELKPNELTVKCYSAEKEQFIPDTENTKFCRTLKHSITLDPQARPAYCYGYGGMRDGQRIPVVSHHTGGQSELVICGAADEVINDDPEIRYFAARNRERKKGQAWMLMGSSVSGPNENYTWLNPGLQINSHNNPNDTVVVQVPRGGHNGRTYYRCAPGKSYKWTVHTECEQTGPTVQPVFHVHDRDGNKVYEQQGSKWEIKAGKNEYVMTCDVPALKDIPSIYTNPDSNNVLHIGIDMTVSGLSVPVIIRRMTLTLKDSSGPTIDPKVIVDGKPYQHQGKLTQNDQVKFNISTPKPNRIMVEGHADGNRRLTWCIRQTALDWQVRNAPVADNGQHLEIGPMRNTFTHKKEIVIAPLSAADKCYVHRMRKINLAKVYPIGRGNKNIVIDVADFDEGAEFEVITTQKPKEVTGVSNWDYDGRRVLIKVDKPGRIEVI